MAYFSREVVAYAASFITTSNPDSKVNYCGKNNSQVRRGFEDDDCVVRYGVTLSLALIEPGDMMRTQIGNGQQ